MAYVVNENCIGCGLCTSLCPEVFEMNDEGLAEAVTSQTEGVTDLADSAMESCPVSAIEKE